MFLACWRWANNASKIEQSSGNSINSRHFNIATPVMKRDELMRLISRKFSRIRSSIFFRFDLFIFMERSELHHHMSTTIFVHRFLRASYLSKAGKMQAFTVNATLRHRQMKRKSNKNTKKMQEKVHNKRSIRWN